VQFYLEGIALAFASGATAISYTEEEKHKSLNLFRKQIYKSTEVLESSTPLWGVQVKLS